MTISGQILYAPDQDEIERKKRIDLKLEQMIIQCAIGLLASGREMSRQDYTRLHLAVVRVRASK